MEERKLNFTRNEDPTIVEDKDGKIAKKIEKIYKDICFNLGFCYEQLKEGNLTEGMKETHLFLTEGYVLNFLDELGYEGVLKKKKDEMYSDIRSLNNENRELRRQLGEKVSNEDVREKLKNISNIIKKWWNIYGFGHVSDISYTEYGAVKLILSGSICHAYRDDTQKAPTDAEKAEYLVNLGFKISLKDRGNVLFTDGNYILLDKMLKEKYPSSTIANIRGHEWGNELSMREIEVYIHNLDDLKNE